MTRHIINPIPTKLPRDFFRDLSAEQGASERARACAKAILLLPDEGPYSFNEIVAMGKKSGLEIKPSQQTITQASQFEKLFPGSGGALYGRASHGWTASFARAGAETKISGLYLAGGSVHPGPGVPMATMSGMLAAEKILA